MTVRLTDERLAKIKALEKAATPGPWSRVKPLGARYWTLGTIRNHTAGPLENEDDWDFVEHARNDVPVLVAEVERLRGIVAELKMRFGVGTTFVDPPDPNADVTFTDEELDAMPFGGVLPGAYDHMPFASPADTATGDADDREDSISG